MPIQTPQSSQKRTRTLEHSVTQTELECLPLGFNYHLKTFYRLVGQVRGGFPLLGRLDSSMYRIEAGTT